MKSSFIKYAVGAVVVLVIAGYAIFHADQAPEQQVAIIPSAPALPSSSGSVSTSTENPSPSAGQFKDGTYTGPVADAFYGMLQVTAVVQRGRIVNVAFPQYPDAPGNTSAVSHESLPILAQEAITAQSAHVNVVSGATQTSEAFQQSLASALAQAH